MMERIRGVTVLWVWLAALCVCGRSVYAGSSQPNVIVLYVDDLGWGDLSAYGHPTSYTPNIQRMADQGLLLTNFYSNSPVCSPSRAGLLTGRYQVRNGIYPGVFDPTDLGGLPFNETTIAEGLQSVGYSTAMVGKWHLGVGENGQYLPNNHGFDYYMRCTCSIGCRDVMCVVTGLMSLSLTRKHQTGSYGIPYTHDDCPCYICFYPDDYCYEDCNPQYVPCPVFECKYGRQKIVQQPADLTSLSSNLLNAATSFISSKASKKTPFFLFYAFQHIHAPQFSGAKFRNSSIRGVYGDSLREIDYAVGKIFSSLKSSGIYNKTFVFLTSDNGPALDQGVQGGSAGLLRCGKASTWDGGMRVPGIAWWPKKIKHRRSAKLASTLDLLPTIFNLAGAQVPQDRIIDGVDMAPILFKSGKQSNREFFAFFPEFVNETIGPYALRWKNYKAHYYTAGGASPNDYPDELCRYNTTLERQDPPLLYDLNLDPQEMNQLDTEEYADVVAVIDQIREEFLNELDWPTPQLLVGKDSSIQPCANAGCSPFPYCCRSSSSLVEPESDQSYAWN